MQSETEQGQGLMEYAMVIITVAIFVLVLLWLLGPAIGRMYSNVISMI